MLPNVTNQNDVTEAEPYKLAQFDAYLTFCALGGMITSDTGSLSSMSVEEFCSAYNISRMTLSRWKKQSGFAMKVRDRRNEVVPLARETAAFNRLFMIGMTSLGKRSAHGDQRAAVDALKTYLGHSGDLQLPTQRQDVTVHGGLADVLRAAVAEGIIEGEIVDPANLDAGTGSQTSEPLQESS